MAFFTFTPRESVWGPRQSTQDDAFVAGLTQALQNLDTYWRPGQQPRCTGGTCPRSERRHRSGPTIRDHPEAWLWWYLNGPDSSDSEDETANAQGGRSCAGGSCPRGRSQDCGPCPAKRKPNRSSSNAPPSKKKEDNKSEENTVKFNFTGKKTAKNDDKTNKDKTEKKQTKAAKDVKVVSLRPAPWSHSVHVGQEFLPEDVRAYVKDGRVRIEGRRERSVDGDDDVIECIEFNREIVPPKDVVLDGLTVFYRSGGIMKLEAPRRALKSAAAVQSAPLVKDLASLNVKDIERDATNAPDEAHEEMKEDKEKHEDNEDVSMDAVQSELGKTDTEQPETDSVEDNDGATADDWEMISEKTHDAPSEPNNEEKATEEPHEAKDDDGGRPPKDEVAPEDTETNVKISEIEEITTEPIVDEPRESEERDVAETPREEKMVVRVVSEEQQEKQIEENQHLMVMNLAGFEPRDVTVQCRAGRVTVRAVRETEEDGFLSRRESLRSFVLPDAVRAGDVTCSMGPEARLVLTTARAH